MTSTKSCRIRNERSKYISYESNQRGDKRRLASNIHCFFENGVELELATIDTKRCLEGKVKVWPINGVNNVGIKPPEGATLAIRKTGRGPDDDLEFDAAHHYSIRFTLDIPRGRHTTYELFFKSD